MRPFADPIAHRQLRRLVADVHPRGPQLIVQLLTDVADRIGGQPAIIAALEELEAASRRRGRRMALGAIADAGFGESVS